MILPRPGDPAAVARTDGSGDRCHFAAAVATGFNTLSDGPYNLRRLMYIIDPTHSHPGTPRLPPLEPLMSGTVLACITGLLFCCVPIAEAASVTVHPVRFSQERVPPGAPLSVTYTFESTGSMADDNSVYVHVTDAEGKQVVQWDHAPSIRTGTPGWIGSVSYVKKVAVPLDLPEGRYDLNIGLYHKGSAGWVNEELLAAEGVEALSSRRFRVGSFIVDRSAPLPVADTAKAPSLDIDGWTLTFDENFDEELEISAWGPIGGDTGLRWIAHTPWRGDFGDARFMDPGPEDLFEIRDGILVITAAKRPEWAASDQWKRPWRSGLICSVDTRGNGFAQQYGYFACRAKLPDGKGVWPAFWLASAFDRDTPGASGGHSIEIDVIEYYGHAPNGYQAAMHVWEPEPHRGSGNSIWTKERECSSGFHDYGVLVEEELTTFYFDGIEVWQVPTPESHKHPLMLLVNLALGSGWPIDETPNPCQMEVDWVRVWAKP